MRRTLAVLVVAACTSAPSDTDTTGPDTAETDDADVLFAAEVAIDPSWTLDFETGTHVESDATDVWWEHFDATTRDLRPRGFTRLARVAEEPTDADACAAAALSFDAIDGSGPTYGDLPVGTWLCVHTTEGHYGKARVSAMTLTADAQLPAITLDYVLWSPPQVPDPALREPTAALAPWLDVRFGWQSDFADTCEVAWFLPDATAPERVDPNLPPDQDASSSPALRWDEAWGNAVTAELTCSRASTGRFASHTFDLTREAPSAPAPVIGSLTGEPLDTGDGWYPWSVGLHWTSENADACFLEWRDPADDNLWNWDGPYPASSDENLVWSQDWGPHLKMVLTCRQDATGRSATSSVVVDR